MQEEGGIPHHRPGKKVPSVSSSPAFPPQAPGPTLFRGGGGSSGRPGTSGGQSGRQSVNEEEAVWQWNAAKRAVTERFGAASPILISSMSGVGGGAEAGHSGGGGGRKSRPTTATGRTRPSTAKDRAAARSRVQRPMTAVQGRVKEAGLLPDYLTIIYCIS